MRRLLRRGGVSSQVVLLLGRFNPEARRGNVLLALKEALPEHGYVPVVFNFPPPENRTTSEMVAILAGHSKFVIADLTDPRSVALEAQLIIPTFSIPFVPLLRKGTAQFPMFESLQSRFPWVLETVEFSSVKSLIDQLKSSVLDRAEEYIFDMQARKRK